MNNLLIALKKIQILTHYYPKNTELPMAYYEISRLATEAINSFQEQRFYSEEEVERFIASAWYKGAKNHFEGKTLITDDDVKEILSPLKEATDKPISKLTDELKVIAAVSDLENYLNRKNE